VEAYSEMGVSKGKTINKKRTYMRTDGRSAQGINTTSRGRDERLTQCVADGVSMKRGDVAQGDNEDEVVLVVLGNESE
jgi:hypothetical protein